MKSLASFACLAAVAVASQAGSGDVYVPAHRSANGTWVPANVPPSSGGTRPSVKVKGRAAAALPPAASPEATAPAMPPLFVSAQPIRR